MSRLAAVTGIGQTKYKTKRSDVSIAGLVREAAQGALEESGLGWKDIDAVVIGKAPDMFEGVVMPELYLSDALGAGGKPIMRVHTAGSVGGSTAVVATSHIHSGRFKRVLTVAFEKQSESNAMWALSIKHPFSVHVNAGAGGNFAPHIREYIRRSGAPEHVGRMVAVKDRRNALKNPLAHLQLSDISMKMVEESPMLWEPLRFLESCPSSDGACAMVITDEAHVSTAKRGVAWIHSTAVRTEPTMYGWREMVDPEAGRDCARSVYDKAGIRNPLKEIDVAEVYVPFSWYEPMWLENLGFAKRNEGWKLTESGETEIDGQIPFNPSGGVLSSNPIGASGMIRFAEAAQQVRGTAGGHQVKGAKTALGHAFGGNAQFFAMWIVGSKRP
jgi:acetyl-CoA C-acetyltransferase